jgi:hypothetical protein
VKRLLIPVCVNAALLFAAKPTPHDSSGPGYDAIPIIILGGEWTTTIMFNNTNEVPFSFPLTFYNQGGQWTVPITGYGNVSLLNISLPALGTLKLEFDYSSAATSVGFAVVNVPCQGFNPGQYCAGVGAYAILRNHNAARAQDFEDNYPLGQSTALSPQQFMFDQSDNAQMVLNLTNTCVQDFCSGLIQGPNATIEIFDENGVRFYVDAETVMPGEVMILNIAQMSSATWNRIGMVRVTSPLDGIMVSGHRINNTGSFTPLVSYNY